MPKRIKQHTIFLLLFTCSIFYSQSLRVTDSLHKLLGTANDDTTKVKLLFELGRNYNTYTSKLRIEYYLEALKLAQKLRYIPGQKKVYNSLVLTLYYQNTYDLAIMYCRENMRFLEKYGTKQELYDTYNLYANLLVQEENISEALKYYHLARGFHLHNNNSKSYANTLNNLTILLLEKNQLDSALTYCNAALDIFRTNKNPSSIGNSLVGLAEIYIKRKEYGLASKKVLEGLKVYESINEIHGVTNCLVVMGMIHLETGSPDSAIILLNQALPLCKQTRIRNLQRNIYEKLSAAYDQTGNYKEAYQYQVLFKKYSDSISLETQKTKMQEMEIRLDVNKKITQLKDQEQEIESKNKQTNYLLAGMCGVVICLIISFWAYYQKKKSNKLISEQKKLVDEKQQEILASIRYAKRIQTSLLPREENITKIINDLNKNNEL